MFPPHFRSCLHPIAFALLTLAVQTPPKLAAAQNPPTVDKLVAMFDDVVFGSEFLERPAEQFLAKWQGLIGLRVQGKRKSYHTKYLQNHLKIILELTGLDLEVVKDEEVEENFTILFMSGNDMQNVNARSLDAAVIKRLALARSCYFISYSEPPGPVFRTIVVVNNERKARDINHCLLEEVLQGLGLPNDSNLIRPSVFSDKDQLTKLTRSDEIIVRALYDERLQIGTPREIALREVRTIIEELDATLPPE